MGILSTILNDAAKKAEDKAKSVLVPRSGWGSRKLWIFASVAMALIWLGRGNLALILDGLIWLTGVYLITQCIHDCVTDFAAAWVQRQKLRCDASQVAPPAVEAAQPSAPKP